MRRFIDHLRFHPHRGAILAVAVVAALGGGVAAGALTAGSSSTLASAAAPTTTTTAPPSPGAAGTAARRGAHGVRGKVTAVSPTRWTVQTASGQTVTVEITSSTRFGPKVVPAKIAVGDEIVVAGSRAGTSVTAARIGMARHSSAPGSAATATTGPGPAPAG
jgi:hypothetical protein